MSIQLDGPAGSKLILLEKDVHIRDPLELDAATDHPGDGVARRALPSSSPCPARRDEIQIDIEGVPPESAELTIIAGEIFLETVMVVAEAEGCPFKNRQETVGFYELTSILRLADRARFEQALKQLSESLSEPGLPIDEARGLGLLFLSGLTSGVMELGAERSMHTFLLEAARRLDRLNTAEAITSAIEEASESLVRGIFPEGVGPSRSRIEEALRYLERNYAQPLSDSDVADRVGMSTSHFRTVFREATRQPFQQYLRSVRLEQARNLLSRSDQSVSEVCLAVGFQSAAHFSRAFSRRFGVTPSGYQQRCRDQLARG